MVRFLKTDILSKTQVVLEYIFRTRNPSTAVFWVSASSASRFVESYKRIALECKIPGHDSPGADVMQLARDWLENQYPLEWLIIVDNVDDRTIFFEQRDDMTTDKCLVEYIPQAAKGSVIYTTRSRDIGVDLASGDEPIEVYPMNIDEGLLMLGDRVTRGSTREDQGTLLEELEYLPLAISQATAYMVKRRRSIADYIKLLQDESTRTRVLDHRTLHHGRQDRSSESVTRTWWITFEWLKKEHPRSAELLTTMCLLDRQQIPLALVQDAGENTFDFEEAIGLLEAFSLIRLYSHVEVCDQKVIDLLRDQRPDLSSMSSKFCDMHRLVQASTREWLSRPENDKINVATNTLVSMSELFPVGNYEDRPLCRILYPHADAVLAFNLAEVNFPLGSDDQIITQNMQHRATLLLNLSTYLMTQGDLALSEERASLSLEIRRRLFGLDESKETLDSMEALALVISRRRRKVEALGMQRRILEGREKLLGYNHTDTLRSVHDLGLNLQKQGEYAEAEVHLRREMARRRTLHEQNPLDIHLTSTLIGALNGVAVVHECQGEFEGAQTLFQEALELGQNINGRKHPQTWDTMACLAMTKGRLRKFQEARALFAEVLAGYEKEFGRTHYLTLDQRDVYSYFLSEEGNYALAEEELKSLLEDEILANRGANYGAMHDLGFVLHQQKKYGEAENTLKHLLHLQEQAASDTKPSVKAGSFGPNVNANASRYFVATCLEAQGKTDEAKKYQHLAPDPSTAEADVEEAKKLHERSLDLYKEGCYEEAEVTTRKELKIRMKHAGLDGGRTQTCLLQIARAVHAQNPFNDSQSLTRQVLAYRQRVYGWGSSETWEALQFLAETTAAQGKFEEAEGHFRQLLLWTEVLYDKLDQSTLYTRGGLAQTLLYQRKYPEAEKLYRLNLEILRDLPVDISPQDTAGAYHNVGLMLWYQYHDAEAEPFLQQAYDRRVQLLGRSDTKTMRSLALLASVVAGQGKHHYAEELFLLLGESKTLPQSEDEDSDEEDSDEKDFDEENSNGEDSDEEDSDEEGADEEGADEKDSDEEGSDKD